MESNVEHVPILWWVERFRIKIFSKITIEESKAILPTFSRFKIYKSVTKLELNLLLIPYIQSKTYLRRDSWQRIMIRRSQIWTKDAIKIRLYFQLPISLFTFFLICQKKLFLMKTCYSRLFFLQFLISYQYKWTLNIQGFGILEN